jgi:hypothetical protein
MKNVMQIAEENFVKKYGKTPDEMRELFAKTKGFELNRYEKMSLEEQKKLHYEYQEWKERFVK